MFDKEAREVVDEAMDTPEWQQLLYQYQYRMNHNFYPQWEIDFCVLKWKSNYDVYDAFFFCKFHYLLAHGEFAICTIPVGCTPFRDKDIERNNRALSNLPPFFKGEFWGALEPDDGILEWNEPFVIYNDGFDASLAGSSDIKTLVEPGNAPLEVGYTKAHTTFFHIMRERRLARWVYGMDDIMLAVATSKFKGVECVYEEA